jgi:serine/threonine protein kinase
MGAVYLARDLKVAADVALKVMRRDTAADDAKRARLYREVRLARLISHRNVARIYDLGEWEGYEFISMEYIKGKTLEQQLREEGAFSLDDGQHVLHELCNGLAAAHTAGIVHRDLKPANIMLEQGGRVVILDFGIARWVTGLHQTKTEEGHAVGTPWYMAPEQFTSENVDHRADIYARLAYMHTSEPPPDPIKLRPDLSSQLAAVIYGCLEKSPRERFSTVAEVVSLIDRD